MSKIDVADAREVMAEAVERFDAKIREGLSRFAPPDADHAHVIVAQSTPGGVVPLGHVTYGLDEDSGSGKRRWSRAYCEGWERTFGRGREEN